MSPVKLFLKTFGIGLLLLSLLLVIGITFAKATPPPGAGDKVFVCKYVGQPGVDETLQTGQNPISVSVNALPPGFSGAFPYAFADAQTHSLAVRYAVGNEQGTLADCPPVVSPSPSVSPSVTPPPTPTPTETPPPTCEETETCPTTPPPPPPTVTPSVSVTPTTPPPTPSPTLTPPPIPPPTPTPAPTPSPTVSPSPSPSPSPDSGPTSEPRNCHGNGANRPKCQPPVIRPTHPGSTELAFTGVSRTVIEVGFWFALGLLFFGIIFINLGKKVSK